MSSFLKVVKKTVNGFLLLRWLKADMVTFELVNSAEKGKFHKIKMVASAKSINC